MEVVDVNEDFDELVSKIDKTKNAPPTLFDIKNKLDRYIIGSKNNSTKYNDILDTIRTLQIEDVFSNNVFNIRDKDLSFVEGKIYEAIMVKLYSLGYKNIFNYILKENDLIERELNNLVDQYLDKANKKNSGNTSYMYEHLMFEIQMSLYKDIEEKISVKKYSVNMVKKELTLLEKRLERIEFHIANITKNIDYFKYKTIVKNFNYIMAELSLKENKVFFYDDLLTLELPLNEKRYDDNILDNVYQCLVDEGLHQIEKDVSSANFGSSTYVMYHYNVYGDDQKNNIHIHMNTSVMGENVYIEPIIFSGIDKKLFRLTGEEVLNTMAISFEILSGKRSDDLEKCKDYLEQLKVSDDVLNNQQIAKNLRRESELRAYNMFLNTLNPAQRKMFEKEKITILEGDEYYYIATEISYNYLIRFKKDLKEFDLNKLEQFEALCIHQGGGVPFFDNLAAINLTLMSGEEDYIDEKSNKFLMNNIHFEVIKNFVSKMKEKKLTFEGLSTLELIY